MSTLPKQQELDSQEVAQVSGAGFTPVKIPLDKLKPPVYTTMAIGEDGGALPPPYLS